MGEYEQPVVGMKSCFHFSELDKTPSTWHARQWFVVRKAEVQICDSDVLIPYVKMGVEAREQVVKGGVLEDKALTRRDHPMAKYAEEFTKNFDLIAERKSVIYHLRELAKASVLAKYLLECHIQLEPAWFNLAAEEEVACSMEVPQLWNERTHALVKVGGGRSATRWNAECRESIGVHGVYGGVQFGLEKFSLATSVGQSRVAAGLSASRLPMGLSRKPAGSLTSVSALGLTPTAAAPLAAVAKPNLRQMAVSRSPLTSLHAAVPSNYSPAVAAAPLAMSAIGAPRLASMVKSPVPAGLSLGKPTQAPALSSDPLKGVDLRLDNFDLSSAKHVSLEAQSGSWGDLVKPLDDCTNLGEAFWSSLECASLFKESDTSLLRSIFNPHLSDRRLEGASFVPPDASYSHVAKLSALVKEEDAVRRERKEAFSRADFDISAPGSLFPYFWTPKMGVVGGALEARPALLERPEFLSQAPQLLQGMLSTVPPSFDKTTEDGMHFRVYRLASLEVRTTQEHDSEEEVCMIFSVNNLEKESQRSTTGQKVEQQDKIKKATEYVERKIVAGTAKGFCYYLVLETENGQKILTERLENGQVVWHENPENLEFRSSLSKVTRCEECHKGTTVRDIQKRATSASQDSCASPSVCKRWARSTYNRLVKKPRREEDPILAGQRTEKLAETRV